jgi:hypothetical protein
LTGGARLLGEDGGENTKKVGIGSLQDSNSGPAAGREKDSDHYGTETDLNKERNRFI